MSIDEIIKIFKSKMQKNGSKMSSKTYDLCFSVVHYLNDYKLLLQDDELEVYKKYSLVGIDGNAHGIMGYVVRAMRSEKCSKDKMDEYIKEATSGNYDNLIQTSIKVLDELNSKYY